MLYNIPQGAWPQVITAAMRANNPTLAQAALTAWQQQYSGHVVLLANTTNKATPTIVSLAAPAPCWQKWQILKATCPAQAALLVQWAGTQAAHPRAWHGASGHFVPLPACMVGMAYNP